MKPSKSNKTNDAMYAVGDILFIKASAWALSTYRNDWPYDVNISSAYFEAQVESIVKETRYNLSFVAFEIDGHKSEYSR